MLFIKAGVSLRGLVPQMSIAVGVVHTILERGGVDTWITSGNDGTHNGHPVAGDAKDPHYEGKALDFRAHEIPAASQWGYKQQIANALGDEYAVFLEFAGTDSAHFHVQYGHTS